MKYLFSTFLMCLGFLSFGQRQWYGELELASVDCDNYQACYKLNIRGVGGNDWALGDQNYRLFYDAENISIESVTSLLPTGAYSQVNLNEDFAIVGQGQEDFSPLDNIDGHLGFLDFSIVSYSKYDPAEAVQVTTVGGAGSPLSVAEICIQVAPELIENVGEEYAVHMYFSRPTTAGQVTNQYTVISEIHEADHTQATTALGFVDLNFSAAMDARLGEVCKVLAAEENAEGLLKQGHLLLSPNPAVMGAMVRYESILSQTNKHDLLIYNEKGQVVELFKELPAGNQEINLPKELSEGIWFVKVRVDGLEKIEELVIVRL